MASATNVFHQSSKALTIQRKACRYVHHFNLDGQLYRKFSLVMAAPPVIRMMAMPGTNMEKSSILTEHRNLS